MDICNSGPDGSAAYKVVAIPQETGLSLMKYNKISESGMQKMKDEADMLCRLCRGLRSKAVKVCHHSDCQEQNGHKPLMLCAECDKTLHESGSHEGHLRFDLPHRAKVFTSGFPHDLSSHSLPAEVTYLEEEEGEDEPDTPVTSVQRNGQGARQVSAGTSKLQEGSTNGQSSVDIEDEGGGRISYERKGSLDSRNMGEQSQQSYGSLPRIKRKKVVKKKFHNNEKLDYADPPQELSKAKQSETLHPLKFALHSLVANSSQFALEHSISRDCFTLKFDMFEELDIEIVTAVAGVTLRDALLPLCEKRAIIVDKLNVFIDASHTPLKLEFDTFHLGGTQLTVKGRDWLVLFSAPHGVV
ncbi:uncharacterized protein LOC106167152 [Lingula anatina]|uniref:Uncharacterized protein LOC106167152 n=1 Tax=Lingula anatina TaxID=7574 RepID=A0A2R2MP26_LINAN|nr:uncharacterized protein LOC106167152 [Lingula anatina]|eukprot:XP_023931777.1 uncharacterized protein LOC106167152 [Lingula anatina]